MKQTIELNLKQILPQEQELLGRQRPRNGAPVSARVTAMLPQALELLRLHAKPKALLCPVSFDDLEDVYEGAGENAQDTPLKEIFPKADHTALFALTLGPQISRQIEAQFKASDYALGYFLDLAASSMVEKGVRALETIYTQQLKEALTSPADLYVLSYSPGYCGWNISAQQKLFRYLGPEALGISLTGSFLMDPLKSATGVLVGGKPDIHLFEAHFSFCNLCKDPTCRNRNKKVLETMGQP